MLFIAGLLCLTPSGSVLAYQPEPVAYLVEDIVPGFEGSNPFGLTDVNGTLYFFTQNIDSGDYELRSANQAATNTEIITSFDWEKYQFLSINIPVNANNIFFFFMLQRDTTIGLWRSDGTKDGTFMLYNFYPMANFIPLSTKAVAGDTLYFTANDGVHGEELWKTDGTISGTMMVSDLIPGSGGSAPLYMTAVDDQVFFAANSDIFGRELWVSDGTAAGTKLVKDISEGDGSSNPNYLTAMDGVLYFEANDPVAGYGLWKSDGTANGTVIVKNFNIYPSSNQSHFTVMDHKLYFSAYDPSYNYELWQSDGTEAGTQMVKDINPSGQSYTSYLTNVNGTLYFRADDGTDTGLWQSDGTEEGTKLIKYVPIYGDRYFYDENADIFVSAYNRVYFVSEDEFFGVELWQSDGTAEGTKLVRDIFPGISSSYPQELTSVNGRLFFTATDSDYTSRYPIYLAGIASYDITGYELWTLGYFTYMPILVK